VVRNHPSYPVQENYEERGPYLEKAEMDALLAAPDRRTVQGQRDYASLLFLYNTGAPADEAAQLKTARTLELANVPRYLSSVQIHGKGNKLRWRTTVDIWLVFSFFWSVSKSSGAVSGQMTWFTSFSG
jgi:site-specific recombinase XerD